MDWNTIVVTFAAVLVAALNAFTAWQASRTRVDMKRIEHNTNSKLDRLIVSEKKVSRAEGRREGREIHERLKDTPSR